MANPLIAIERKQLLVDWWNRQSSPTFLAAARATGMSQSNVPLVLEEMGVDVRRGDKRTGDVRAKMGVVEKWSEILTTLQAITYKDVCREALVVPRKLPCTGLFIPDAHGNYWNPEVTSKVLEQVGDVDLVITNEVLTMDSSSFFRPTYSSKTIDELKAIGGFFEMLRSKVKHPDDVIVTTSNHDSRFVKWMMDHTRNFDQIETAAEAWRCLFDKYIKLRPRMIASPRVQVGTAIFSHPDAYLKEQGRTAMREGTKCKLNYRSYGMKPPFEFVAVGHPHRLGMVCWEGELGFVAEAGCQCFFPRYAMEDTAVRPCTQFPMVNGAVKFTLDKHGKVVWDIGYTGTIFVGFAGLPEHD